MAYGSLLQERRRALHARIVEAVERLYADRLAELVERLAYHALRGELWDQALAYLRQAGAKAFARSANREATWYFEQALEALRNLPRRVDTLEQAVDVRIDLRNALWPLGNFSRILEYLQEAEVLAGTLSDQRRSGLVLSYVAGYFWRMGEHDHALESGRRALAIAETREDFALQVVAMLYLGLDHHAQGSYERAIETLAWNIASLQGPLIHERHSMPGLPSVVSRAFSAWCCAELGEFAEGLALGDEAARLAEETNQPYSLTLAYLGAALPRLRQGELEAASALLERGLATSNAVGLLLLSPQLLAPLGYACVLLGRTSDALPLLEDAAEQDTLYGLMTYHALTLTYLGEAYLLAGRAEDATRCSLQALERSSARDERGHQAYTSRLLGQIAAAGRPPDIKQAEAWYRQALALAEELGMRPLVAHCRLGLGKLYRRTGRPDEARAELSTAIEMLRAMEMTFWLPEAEAELARLDG